jgi:peptidoglycan/xylan/chitin deacetylase (PgdA/CDA1 family)
MPWKQNYTISDEKSLPDSRIRWPDGARCCFSVTVDLSVAAGPEGIRAADLTTGPAYFGMHEGLSGLRAVFARHGIRATFAVPAVMARIQAETVRSLAAEGHEIAANGLRHEDVSGLDRAEEKARIERTGAIIAEVAGSRPVGWYSLPRQGDPFASGTISPNTMDLLIEAGYEYMGNGLADDIPHWWVTDFATRRAILAMPYYYHFDDQWFLMFPSKGTGLEHADFLFRNWRAEFAAQYGRGRHFHMVLHPRHIGWAHRLQLLDEFLAHALRHPGLWNPTAAECARHWKATYPKESHLRLEPSIWKDYPGSLS